MLRHSFSPKSSPLCGMMETPTPPNSEFSSAGIARNTSSAKTSLETLTTRSVSDEKTLLALLDWEGKNLLEECRILAKMRTAVEFIVGIYSSDRHTASIWDFLLLSSC